MDRIEKAHAIHAQTFNCAQAVALAFEDKVDIDKDTLAAAVTGFALGGADMQGTCGAMSAVFLMTGLMLAKKYPNDPGLRKMIISANKQLAKKFREKNGSTICKDLKGLETGRMLRSCGGCVEDAAVLLEQFIKENEI